MAKSGAACHVARHGGNVDVTQAVLLVANVTLFFEHAELGADGGVAELIGELRQDLPDGGALQLIEDVHDLALAAGESAWLGLFRHVLFLQQLCYKTSRTEFSCQENSSEPQPTRLSTAKFFRRISVRV